MIKEIRELFQKLTDKYGRSKKISENLKEKYQYKSNFDINNKSENDYEELYFSDDEEKNKQQFERLMQTYVETKMTLLEVCRGMKDEDTYEKLLNKYESRICKLQDKQLWNKPEKLADELIKIINQTIMKSWVRKNTQNILRDYFVKNGFKVVYFKKGNKLSDDDLSYIDSMYLSGDKELTHDKSRDYEVIEMIQPIIKVAYDDDGDKEYKSLPGRCKCYIYTRGGEDI